MTARDKVVEAIKEFNWGYFSLDEVALGLADYPEYQKWPDALADAVLKALDAQPFHTVNLREDGWTLKHPLDCRDRLFECEYNAATPGVYRVSLGDRGWLVIEERVGQAVGT